jgi:hypothetical protein
VTKASRQDQACDAQGEGEKVTVHGWPLPLWNDRRIWPAIGKDGVNQFALNNPHPIDFAL